MNIFEVFRIKEYKNSIESLKLLYNKEKSKNTNLLHNYRSLNSCREIVNQLSPYKYDAIFIYETPKKRSFVIYYIIDGTEITIAIKDAFNQSTQCDLQLFAHVIETSIYIDDIQIAERDCNKGFGTAALQLLIEIAKEKDYKEIRGTISFVDIDHIDRLNHFYKKNGFQVKMNTTQKGGSVCKAI